MLRVAIPNKGSLSEAATTMLTEAGYSLRTATKSLVHRDPANKVEFFYLRPRDIAIYIGRGILDLGITGRDLLAESRAEAEEILSLGFGTSWFHYAGPSGKFHTLDQLADTTIATSYPNLVADDLARRGINAQTVKLDGAVEVSIELGVADAIADVVETGTTLKMSGLEVFGEPILESEAVLIRRDGLGETTTPEMDVFIRRVQSVMVARNYVLIDYDIRTSDLARATAITSGFESPTISDLRDPQWSAVRVMVSTKEAHAVMDELYAVGARAILVTTIDACRI